MMITFLRKTFYVRVSVTMFVIEIEIAVR